MSLRVREEEADWQGFIDEPEMSALGCMMLSTRACKQVRAIVSAQDFYWASHREIYSAVCRVVDSGGEPDLVSVPAALDAVGKFKEIGLDTLIQVMDTVPSAHNAAYYAQIVKDLSTLRKLEAARLEAGAVVRNGEIEVSERITQVQALFRGVKSSNATCIDLFEVAEADAPQGVPTGIEGLDRGIECRGLPKGQMTIWAARKKVGKTSGMTQVCANAADTGHRVLYVTLADLTPAQVWRRMRRQITGQSDAPADLFKAKEWQDTVNAKRNSWDLKFADAKVTGRTIEELVPAIEVMQDDNAFDLVVIDYAQKLGSSKERDRVRSLERVSSELAFLADRCGFALLVGSQVTEDGKTRYSQEFEDDCGLLVRVGAPDGLHVPLREFDIPFSRFGPPFSFNAFWDKNKLVFYEAGR